MSHNVISRVRNLQRAQTLHGRILEFLQHRDGRKHLKEFLESFTAEEVRIVCTRIHIIPDRKSKSANISSLLTCTSYNPIYLKAEVQWGRKWTGSYYALTPGEGVSVTVMECVGNNFKGCPCGSVYSGHDVEQAIRNAVEDFYVRSRYEYTGPGEYSRGQLIIKETRDYRTPQVQQ